MVTYTPKKTMDAEAAIAKAWQDSGGPIFDVPCEVQFVFDVEGMAIIIEPLDLDMKTKLRGDLDNYVKTALDALNKVAFTDDRLVTKLVAVKL